MLEVNRCWASKGEQSIDMQGEENKKRGGRGQGAAANAWVIMIQDQRAKEALIWAMVGGVKNGFIDRWLVDKNKGDNYVVISLCLVTSLVHYLVTAPTNLAFSKFLKMNELVG